MDALPNFTDADQALRVTGLNLRSLFDRFPFAVQVFGLDGQAIYANPALEELWGPRDESALRPPLFERPHLVELGLMPYIHRGFAGETVALPPTCYTPELVKRIRGGTPRWVQTYIYPIRDGAGTLRAAVVMHIDITEQRQATERLQEREEQYRAIFEATSDGLVINDLDTGVIVEANPEFCRMHGYTREEMIGLHPSVLIAPPYHAVFTSFLETARAGLPFQARVAGVRKDGSPFWVEVRAKTFAFLGRRHVMGVTHDVTEEEEAQQRLEARVDDRTRELSTLLEVSRSVSSTLELAPVLDLVLGQLKLVADYTGATVLALEGDTLCILHDRGGDRPDSVNSWLVGRRVPVAQTGVLWDAISRREPVIIDDARTDEPFARAYRELNRDLLETPAIRHVRSWLAVPLVVTDRVIGVLSISGDEPRMYTSRHAALATAIAGHAAVAIENARLYEQQRQTAVELESLLDVSRAVTSTLEPEPLLGIILDQLKLVVDYVSAVVVTESSDGFRWREYRGPLPRASVLSRQPTIETTAEAAAIISRGEPFIIPDIWGESAEGRLYREQMGEEYLRTTASYVRCMLLAPLMQKGRMSGALVLTHQTPGYYTAHHAALASAVANQAAVAIENADLFEQERRTARELASLLEVSHNVASILELEPLLDVILDQIKLIADYDGSSIVVLEGETLRTMRRRAPTEFQPGFERTIDIPRQHGGDAWRRVARRETVIIGDIRADEPLARAYRETVGVSVETSHLRYIRSWMAVPLALKDRVIGMIVLAHGEVGFYTERHATLVAAIATQAATVIENARLYEQAHKLAALEERQRLARELHDSVSQVLFSIGLGARTARTLLERGSPDRAVPSVEYILNLAEMGQAEMRALLFELRPESLETEGLVAAITKQAAALRARHSIEVDATLCDEPDVPLEVKEAVYRIAQEATHNTVKHARASRITVRLACDADGVQLDVRDNGAGFDTSGDFPGHLGLTSMRERVARLGGTIALESVPGEGTAVRVRVPVPRLR